MKDLANGLRAQLLIIAAAMGGLDIVEVAGRLTPPDFESADTADREQYEKHGCNIWNKRAAMEVTEKLKAEGWEEYWDSDMGGVRYKRMRWADPKDSYGKAICVDVYYKPTNEDKCRDLKRQLADLGCHY